MQYLYVGEMQNLNGRESEYSRAQRDREPAETAPIEHECHPSEVQYEAGNNEKLKRRFAVVAHHAERHVKHAGTEEVIGVSHNVLVRIVEPRPPEGTFLAGNVLIRMLQNV